MLNCRKRESGFVDPLTLIASAFLLLTLLISTIQVLRNQNPQEKAADAASCGGCNGGFEMKWHSATSTCSKSAIPCGTSSNTVQTAVGNSAANCQGAWCSDCGGFCITGTSQTCSQAAAIKCGATQTYNAICSSANAGQVVVYSSGANDYRKCVNGAWTTDCGGKPCVITDLSPGAVPTYLQTTYNTAMTTLQAQIAAQAPPPPAPAQQPTAQTTTVKITPVGTEPVSCGNIQCNKGSSIQPVLSQSGMCYCAPDVVIPPPVAVQPPAVTQPTLSQLPANTLTASCSSLGCMSGTIKQTVSGTNNTVCYCAPYTAPQTAPQVVTQPPPQTTTQTVTTNSQSSSCTQLQCTTGTKKPIPGVTGFCYCDTTSATILPTTKPTATKSPSPKPTASPVPTQTLIANSQSNSCSNLTCSTGIKKEIPGVTGFCYCDTVSIIILPTIRPTAKPTIAPDLSKADNAFEATPTPTTAPSTKPNIWQQITGAAENFVSGIDLNTLNQIGTPNGIGGGTQVSIPVQNPVAVSPVTVPVAKPNIFQQGLSLLFKTVGDTYPIPQTTKITTQNTSTTNPVTENLPNVVKNDVAASNSTTKTIAPDLSKADNAFEPIPAPINNTPDTLTASNPNIIQQGINYLFNRTTTPTTTTNSTTSLAKEGDSCHDNSILFIGPRKCDSGLTCLQNICTKNQVIQTAYVEGVAPTDLKKQGSECSNDTECMTGTCAKSYLSQGKPVFFTKNVCVPSLATQDEGVVSNIKVSPSIYGFTNTANTPDVKITQVNYNYTPPAVQPSLTDRISQTISNFVSNLNLNSLNQLGAPNGIGGGTQVSIPVSTNPVSTNLLSQTYNNVVNGVQGLITGFTNLFGNTIPPAPPAIPQQPIPGDQSKLGNIINTPQTLDQSTAQTGAAAGSREVVFTPPTVTQNIPANINAKPSGLTSIGSGPCTRITGTNKYCDGSRMYDLYVALKGQTDAWWNKDGDFTPAKFLGLMLMAEATGSDPQFVRAISVATSNQLWGSAPDHQPYCTTPDCAAGIFNFLGAYSQSAGDRYNTVLSNLNKSNPQNTPLNIGVDQSVADSFAKNGITLNQLADYTIYHPVSTVYNNDVPTQWGNVGCGPDCADTNWVGNALGTNGVPIGTTNRCGVFDTFGNGYAVVYTNNQKYNWSLNNTPCSIGGNTSVSVSGQDQLVSFIKQTNTKPVDVTNFNVFMQTGSQSDMIINKSKDTLGVLGCGPSTALNILNLTGHTTTIDNVVNNFFWNCSNGPCTTNAHATLYELQNNGFLGVYDNADKNRITDATQLKNYTGILTYGGTVTTPTGGQVAHIAGFDCNNGNCVSIDSYFGGGKPVSCTIKDSSSIECGGDTYHVGATSGYPDALYPVTGN